MTQQPDSVSPQPVGTVRRPSLGGRHAVAALWFPADWHAEGERRRRMLAAWRRGARASAFASGDLLLFAEAVDVDCAVLDGWPMVRRGALLCSADLEEAELGAVSGADLLIVRGARVESLRLADGKSLDAADWLGIDAYGLLDTYDCSEALPEAELLVDLESRDLREVLGGAIAPPSAEQAAFMKAMLARAGHPGAARPSTMPSSASSPSGQTANSKGFPFLAILIGIAFIVYAIATSDEASNPLGALLLVAAIALVAWLSPPARRAPQESRNSWTVDPRPQARSGGAGASGGGFSPLQRAAAALKARREPLGPQRWRDALARLAVFTQVSRLIGRAQAAYLRRMLEMFESGRIEDALRHAIPLNKSGEPGGGSLGQALGTPRARDHLALGSELGPAASIHLPPEIRDYLQALYRKSFESLDRQGRVDEAVFVLAELLQERQEALDYLEKHRRYTQAAELALAWDMPPATIVRMHCLVGDWARAVAVARRDDAFASAITQLEAKWPDAARRLRLEWAEALVARGDWLAAVDLVWKLESERERAAEWLQLAERSGGRLSVQALVKRAVLLPDTVDMYAPNLLALRDEAERSQDRAALAEALLALDKADQRPQTRSLARIILPRLLADHGAQRSLLPRKSMQLLLNLAGDTLLLADLPAALPLDPQTNTLLNQDCGTVEVPAAGKHTILDAVPLDGERYLLALGEAGAAVVDTQGRVLFRLAQPAERLVIAGSRQLALGLARRGDMWRVSRLDLVRRVANDLGVARFSCFADSFDGIAWTVAVGRSMRVLDVTQSLQQVLWQVNDLPGEVRLLTRTDKHERLLMGDGRDGLEAWCYHLPQRRLGIREPVRPDAGDEEDMLILSSEIGLFKARLQTGTDGTRVLRYEWSGSRELAVDSAEPWSLQAQLGAGWLSLGIIEAEGTSNWRLVWLSDARPRLQLRWPGGARCRHDQGHWLLFDDAGRLLCVDLNSGRRRTLSLQI